MKNGTAYAAKLKKAYAKLRRSASEIDLPERDDPLRRLAIAILSVGSRDEDGQRAVKRAFSSMVDWNEMRVSNAAELSEAIGHSVPNAVARCQCLIDALRDIYDRENKLSLDHLTSMGRRDAKQYLESLGGVDEYAAASVLLWSLGAHAVPVGDRLLTALREASLVHPDATRAEVQAFLERHVSAVDGKEFCMTIRSMVGPKTRSAPRARAAKTTGKNTRKTSRTAKPR